MKETKIIIPSYNLYGEAEHLPDTLHIEPIRTRAGQEDWRIRPHTHPHLHQIFLIQSGAAEVSIEDTLQHPDLPCLISIPSGSVHGFSFSPDTNGHVITVQTAALPDLFAPTSDIAGILSLPLILPTTRHIEHLVGTLVSEHAAPAPGRVAMLRGLAAQLLCQIARATPNAEDRPNRARAAQLLSAFQTLLHRHHQDRWQVAEYATALGVTPTHLSRVLRQTKGQSASAMIEAHTFREACRQLAYTRQAIRQISFDLGYEDPAYFSRQFKRHVGVTPSAYRKRINAG